MKISNVKAHFLYKPDSLTKESLLENNANIVYHSNYWTFRPVNYVQYVYVVFPTRGFVNVCGIRSFEDCEFAQAAFIDLFSVETIRGITVDNSTANGKLPYSELDLTKLMHCTSDVCKISIRPHYFPAAVIRPKNKSKFDINSLATAILFPSGKFVIVGGKNKEQIERSHNNLVSLLQKIIVT